MVPDDSNWLELIEDRVYRRSAIVPQKLRIPLVTPHLKVIAWGSGAGPINSVSLDLYIWILRHMPLSSMAVMYTSENLAGQCENDELANAKSVDLFSELS